MKRLFLLITVFIATSATAQNVNAPRLHILDNGMRVITVEDRSNPIVSAVWTAHVGDSAEPRDFTGNSHFLEHLLLFRGTEKFPKNQIGEWAASRGGYFNGYTWYDYTAFVLMTSSADLDGILDRHAEMMFHGAFSGQDFETEKSAVFEELRSGQDQPFGYLWREVAYHMYPEETFYSRSTIGTIETVEAATVEQVSEYYKAYYVPNNMTLAVVGDFNTEDLLLQIEERMSAYPAGDIADTPYEVVPMKPGINVVTEERDVSKAYLVTTFEGPQASSPEWFPYLVLTDYLAGGNTSVLFTDLVTEKQLIDDIYMSNWPRRFAKGWQGISTETEVEKVIPAVDALWQNLAAVGNNGISDADLSFAKQRLLKQHWLQLDDVNEVAETLAIADAHGDYRLFSDFEARLAAVTAADVQAVAKKYLTPDRFFLMTLFPPGETPDNFAAQIRENASRVGASVGSIRETELDSGITLLHELKQGASMESYTAAIRAGSRYGDAAGLAEAVATMMGRETTTFGKLELQNYLAENGLELNTWVTSDAAFVSVQAPTGSSDVAMSLLTDVLTKPAFSEEEWTSAQSEMLSAIESAKDQPQAVVNDATVSAVFAGTAYGRSMDDEYAALQEIDAADLRDFYDDYYKASSIAVAYTGAAASDVVADGLSGLNALEGRAKSVKSIELDPVEGKTHVPRAMEGRQQTNLTIVWHAPDAGSDDLILWQLAVKAIGGDLAGRLWKLRQDEGLAYSVWMFSDVKSEQPISMIYMATAAEKRSDALAAIHREVARLQSGLTQDELDRVKVSFIANLNRLDRTAARRSNRHASWWSTGYGANHRERLTEVVAGASLEDVNRVIREVVDPENYIFVEAGAVGELRD
ncbi:MAG: M16 family metallopeptidase [Woeseiaceae bacterium]